MSKNRQNEYLGVNKIGKNIRKSPLHQPNFTTNPDNHPARPQSQPQIYNISKTDFRSIVQQLTGSPSRNDPLPRPPNNPPKNPSMRLQRIRPPPLTPINRPPVQPMVVSQPPLLPRPQGVPMGPLRGQFDNGYGRPVPHFGQPALSPISAYMQQLQSCIGEGGQRPGQQQMPGQVPSQHHMPPQGYGYMPPQPPNMQPQPRGHFQGHGQGLLPAQPPNMPAQPPNMPAQPPNMPAQPPHHLSSGLLPNPNGPPLPSPGTNGPGPGLLPSPTSQFLLPSPRGPPGLLPSPTSQFPPLPSPGGYFNLLSPGPRSPYPPLLSPGSQFPPLSPNFAFSPFGQHGVLGSGPHPPPLSPGIAFPSSPSGIFPMLSPRWRDQ